MTYQIQKLEEVRLGDAEATLYNFSLANPGATYKEAAAATGLSLSSVCGRFTDLAEKGLMWNDKQPKQPATLHATDDPTDIRRNRYLYEADKDRKDFEVIRKALNRLRERGKIEQQDVNALRGILRRINKNA